jgi:hypothetical protein
MQRLALMMAVMMLGMPPVNGYDTSVGPGNREQGIRQSRCFPLLRGSTMTGGPWQREKGSARLLRLEACLWSQEGFQSSGSRSKSSEGWKDKRQEGGTPEKGKGTPAPREVARRIDPKERPPRKRWTL